MFASDWSDMVDDGADYDFDVGGADDDNDNAVYGEEGPKNFPKKPENHSERADSERTLCP